MGGGDQTTRAERVTHRVSRFLHSVGPTITRLDRALAEEWLTHEELRLFLSQSEADQRHAIAVARLLLQAGYASHDLVVAALLHDAGKREASYTPWHRTAIALLEAWAPRMLRWLSRRRSRLLAPFAAHVAHPGRGALLALAAGASERCACLVRRHHDSAGECDQELAMLRWADDHA